jgi:DNA-binding CsgD family transcriptional regulator
MKLTPRESQLLRHAIACETAKEMAETLGVSVRTAEVRLSNLLQKFGVESARDLARAALEKLGPSELPLTPGVAWYHVGHKGRVVLIRDLGVQQRLVNHMGDVVLLRNLAPKQQRMHL